MELKTGFKLSILLGAAVGLVGCGVAAKTPTPTQEDPSKEKEEGEVSPGAQKASGDVSSEEGFKGRFGRIEERIFPESLVLKPNEWGITKTPYTCTAHAELKNKGKKAGRIELFTGNAGTRDLIEFRIKTPDVPSDGYISNRLAIYKQAGEWFSIAGEFPAYGYIEGQRSEMNPDELRGISISYDPSVITVDLGSSYRGTSTTVYSDGRSERFTPANYDMQTFQKLKQLSAIGVITNIDKTHLNGESKNQEKMEQIIRKGLGGKKFHPAPTFKIEFGDQDKYTSMLNKLNNCFDGRKNAWTEDALKDTWRDLTYSSDEFGMTKEKAMQDVWEIREKPQKDKLKNIKAFILDGEVITKQQYMKRFNIKIPESKTNKPRTINEGDDVW